MLDNETRETMRKIFKRIENNADYDTPDLNGFIIAINEPYGEDNTNVQIMGKGSPFAQYEIVRKVLVRVMQLLGSVNETHKDLKPLIDGMYAEALYELNKNDDITVRGTNPNDVCVAHVENREKPMFCYE